MFLSSLPPPPPGPLKSVRKDSGYTMVFINDKCLSLGEELGQGEFGSVLRGKYKPPGGKSVSLYKDHSGIT